MALDSIADMNPIKPGIRYGLGSLPLIGAMHLYVPARRLNACHRGCPKPLECAFDRSVNAPLPELNVQRATGIPELLRRRVTPILEWPFPLDSAPPRRAALRNGALHDKRCTAS